jgi:hypothetical protein
MSANLEGPNEEKLVALSSDLKELSGKYGKIERRVNGTLISNDEGYSIIMSKLREQLTTKKEGIGMVIGSGGLASLLPELPVDTVLMLDMNPAVLELNKVIFELIKSSESPDEVFRKLTDPAFRSRTQILKDIDSIYEDIDITTAYIRQESIQYGDQHWSNLSRFNLVKEALLKKPVVFIAADIANLEFGKALGVVSKKYNEKVSFVNFTNVHTWIKPTTMDFINEWPIEPDAAILYSSHKNALVGDWPKMYLAKNPREYIRETNEDHRQSL